MGRWLAVDPGTKRIGLAVGNTTDGIAMPLAVLAAEPRASLPERIVAAAREYEAVGLVVGWPLNMDDSEGPEGIKARQLAAELAKATGLDVRMWDERLSSFTADRALAGLWTRKKRKALQDAIAAATFLQDFLSCGGPDCAPGPGEIPDR